MKAKYIIASAAVIVSITGIAYAATPQQHVNKVSDSEQAPMLQAEVTTTPETVSTPMAPSTAEETTQTPTDQPSAEPAKVPQQAPQTASTEAPTANQPATVEEQSAPVPAPKLVSKTMHYVDISDTQQDGYCTYVWSDGVVVEQRIGTRQTPRPGVMQMDLSCYTSPR